MSHEMLEHHVVLRRIHTVVHVQSLHNILELSIVCEVHMTCLVRCEDGVHPVYILVLFWHRVQTL